MRKTITYLLCVVVTAFALLLLGMARGDNSSDAQALREMKRLQDALAMYRSSHDRYPTASEGLAALTQGTRPVMPSVPDDPWGRPYIYEPQRPTLLRTLGEDGRDGTDDDLRPDGVARGQWRNPFYLY